MLTGTLKLKSPLSHISESIGVTSYLVQEPIIQPDGSLEEVFCYSGNAWRGQLRDLAAMYMLEKLEMKVNLDSFHLLFSGGKIGGDQKIDVEKIKSIRESIPVLALFGGGIGNSIMPGLMRVGNCYPVCKEALPVLPEKYSKRDDLINYSDATFEKEFSRVDDAKKTDFLDNFVDEQSQNKPKKKKKDVSDQMRMETELVCAGVELYSYIDFIDDSELYLGVIVSALSKFSNSPFIGGQNNKGHGLIDLFYDIDGAKFLQIVDSQLIMTDYAKELLNEYSEYIQQQKDDIIKVLA